MPRISDDTLVQRAIWAAALDRRAMADAYDHQGPEAEKALADAKAVLALRGRRLADLDEEGREYAFLALVWAEQWEESLAESLPAGSAERQGAARTAAAYRKLRLRRFGKTAFETMLKGAVPVPITDLFKKGNGPGGRH